MGDTNVGLESGADHGRGMVLETSLRHIGARPAASAASFGGGFG